METINSLLNLPEHASPTQRACAVYELLQETDNIQAARATAESRLSALREATSHIFTESICAARGITDADAQEDIRAAWCQDPYAALNALAGDNITASNPYGCNQYGHEWRGKHGEGWQPRGDRQRDKKKDEEEKKKKESGPPKHKNGAFKIPALEKALAIPTSAPGEKQAPIFKPSYMTDKQFKDALDGMDKDGKKSLSDALKKIAPRTDKNGQGLMPFADNKSDAEIDNFEKASTDKKREILSDWKKKVRDARLRKDGTEKKEAENLFDKIRKIGKKRGWSKEKLDSTLKGIEIDLKSDYDTFLV